MEQNDEPLVQSALKGDKDAFSTLVKKYQGMVYGLCFHYIGNFADAQEMAQEAFLKAYLKLSQLEQPAKFANWLRAIAANLCKNFLSRSQPHCSLAELPSEELGKSLQYEINPTEQLEHQELRDAVHRILNILPEEQRLVLTLYHLDELPYSVIANFLDVPVGTVRSRLHRAKRQFRKEMIRMVQNQFEQAKLPDEFVEQVEKMRRQTEGCMKNLSAIWDALKAYQQEHHTLPGALEELYPEYLEDLGMLMCPTNTKRKVVPPGHIAPCYDYGASSDSVDQVDSPLPWPTRYDIKERERQFFGDAVSIVRCENHPESLHLSFSGDIYESEKHHHGWGRTGRCIDEYLKRLPENLRTAPRLCRGILMSTKMAQAPDMNKERFGRLIEILEAEVKAHPENSWAHLMLIQAHLGRFDFACAAGYFEKAEPIFEGKKTFDERIRASGSLMYEQLGQFYHETEDYPKAIQCLEKSLEYEKDAGRSARLAQVYVAAGEHEAVLQIADKMGENFGGLAEIYESAGMYEEAIEAYQQASQISKQRIERRESQRVEILSTSKEHLSELLAKMAFCYEKLGDFQQAEMIRRDISPSSIFRWLGRTAPDFTLPDIDGQPVRLSQFRGKVVVLNIWFWSELKSYEYDIALHLDKLAQKYKDAGLVVLEVNQLEGSKKVEAMEVIRDKISHLTLWGGKEVFQMYGTCGYAGLIFGIDQNGIWRYHAKDIRGIEPMIKKLIADHSHK